MASGDFLLQWAVSAGQAPASGYATFDFRNGRMVADFDAAAIESLLFFGFLPPNYSGGGLTAIYPWTASTATSGVTRWGAAIERGNTDIDADSFATQQVTDGTTNATSGIVTLTSIVISSGANMDSLVAGEPFWLQAQRVATHANDTMAGDGELWGIVLKET
jgi:hypothetical protein